MTSRCCAPRSHMAFEGVLFCLYNAWVTYQFCPLLAPRDGSGEAATFDVVPFVGDPRKCGGQVAFPPAFGPPRTQG